MARGQRKPIEDKIREKEEVIAALKVRISSEEKELAELRKEKREKEVAAISSMLEESNLSIEEAKEILGKHIAGMVGETA